MIHNLINQFDREIEILDVSKDGMYYVLDRKSSNGNLCEILYYDFSKGNSQYIMTVKGARLYESFRTFPLNEKYFFIETVGEDYKLRLEKVSKENWKREGLNYIVPEGEILNIYPVNDDYLIVTEEVQATDEILEKFDDEDFEGRYYTLSYLYRLYDGEKYYIQQILDQHQINDFFVTKKNIILNLHKGKNSTKLKNVIVSLQIDQILFSPKLEIIYETDNDIQFIKKSNYPVAFIDKGEQTLVKYGIDRDLKCHLIEKLRVPEEGEVLISAESGKIFHIDTDGAQVVISDLHKKTMLFTYDKAYGDFSGIISENIAVTNFFKTEMLREDMVFREMLAIHHIETEQSEVEEIDGCAFLVNEEIILLRSFLYL